jgi:hypothetical protein
MAKDDEYRYEGNIRSAPYDPQMGDGTMFVLHMDSKKYSHEEQDQWANWISMAMLAKKAHDENLEEVERLQEGIRFRYQRGSAIALLSQEHQRILLDGLHWGICWVWFFVTKVWDKVKPDSVDWDAGRNSVFIINREYSDKKDG